MNPLSGDEQSFGGYNLVQWDMLDRSHQSLSNEEIEDTIAAPFNLAEHEKAEQKAISRETSAQIRAREAEEFKKRMSPMQNTTALKPAVEKKDIGQPIMALVMNGSPALKLNVHELTGAEEQVDLNFLMTNWELNVHAKNTAFDNNDVLDDIHDKVSPIEYLQKKRADAKNFGSELDDLRIAQGDQTVLQ